MFNNRIGKDPFSVLLCLICLFHASNVIAANWHQVHETNEKKMYLDLDSISKSDGLIQFWARTEYAAPGTNSGGVKYQSELINFSVSCENKSIRFNMVHQYNASGTQVEKVDFSKHPEYHRLEPQPPGSVLLEFIDLSCSYAENGTVPLDPNKPKFINEDGNGSRHIIYPGSIKLVDADLVEYVGKIEHKVATTERGKGVLYMVVADCKNNKFAPRASSVYNEANDVIASLPTLPYEKLKYGEISPYAITYPVFEYACKEAAARKNGASTGPHATNKREGNGYSMSGSGFFVDSNGTVVTNHHVVGQCKNRYAIKLNNELHDAKLLKSDQKLDLALLKADLRTNFATIRRDSISVGQAIFVAGYPLSNYLSSEMNYTQGIVSSIVGVAGDSTRLQITAPVQPGNSGGPLLDSAGQIAGVVVSKLNALAVAKKTGDIPQNVNFAIKKETLKMFLDAANVKHKTSSKPEIDQKQIAANARDYTVQVLCE